MIIQEISGHSLRILGETMGYVMSGYVIPTGLKAEYQTEPLHVAVDVQSGVAYAKGSTPRALGMIK